MSSEPETPLCASIAHTVRTARRAQGLTQAELALAAGVSTPFLSALENGKPSVRFDVMLRVLKTLNIQLRLIMPDDENPGAST